MSLARQVDLSKLSSLATLDMYSVHLATVTVIFSLILLLVFNIIHANESSTILVCIGQNKENQCNSQRDANCNSSSLAVLPQLLKKHTIPHIIQFCTSQIELDHSILFYQLYNVTFIGVQDRTMIHCTSKAGMSFTESEGIHLENLIFDQCGALHDSDFCQCHK